MSARRSNQGGAILTFIIIAAILAAVTIGTIYFVQKRGELTRRDQAIAQADKAAADQKQRAKDAEKNATKPSDTSTDPRSAGGATTVADTGTASNTTAAATAELPRTGASESMTSLLAIGLMVATTTAYTRSRRALKQPL